MGGAFPQTLNRTGRSTSVASQIAELALLLVGQFPRPASVPAFKEADESKVIPTLAPVLDAVEMDRPDLHLTRKV
jgi:hypothetical protein